MEIFHFGNFELRELFSLRRVSPTSKRAATVLIRKQIYERTTCEVTTVFGDYVLDFYGTAIPPTGYLEDLDICAWRLSLKQVVLYDNWSYTPQSLPPPTFPSLRIKLNPSPAWHLVEFVGRDRYVQRPVVETSGYPDRYLTHPHYGDPNDRKILSLLRSWTVVCGRSADPTEIPDIFEVQLPIWILAMRVLRYWDLWKPFHPKSVLESLRNNMSNLPKKSSYLVVPEFFATITGFGAFFRHSRRLQTLKNWNITDDEVVFAEEARELDNLCMQLSKQRP
jgi:hypothetical protein